MNWLLGFFGIAFLVIGLVGQAFEMRNIRITTSRDDELGSPTIFTNKKNFKWYAIIGAGIMCWILAERT